jgi:transcriptional regulator with GAF, ATPase, and Fis domain
MDPGKISDFKYRAPRQLLAVEFPELIQKFHDLLFEIAARFVTANLPEIDQEMFRSLTIVGEFWDFDLIILAELEHGARKQRVIYSHPSIDLIQFPKIIDEFPPYPSNPSNRAPDVLSGKSLIYEHIGISNGRLSIPLGIHGNVNETIFISCLRLNHWPEELVEQLYRYGELLTGLLKRKQTADFINLLSEMSANYIDLSHDKIEDNLRSDFARLSKDLRVDTCSIRFDPEVPLNTGMKPFVWFLDKSEDSNRNMLEWFEGNSKVADEGAQFAADFCKSGRPLSWERVDDLPDVAKIYKECVNRLGLKSGLVVPIRWKGSYPASISVCTTRTSRPWPETYISRVRLFGEVFVNAIMRKQSEEKLRSALAEIKVLKERIEADYIYLKEESDMIQGDYAGIVGKSDALRKILQKVQHVAPTDTTVLILGETGTGKGLLARVIHNASRRKDRPLMTVNCAALTPTLIESELFGHEKGSFTGATQMRLGRFEAANGTTLFLDEIGDLPLDLQSKLLRVLEEGEFERVGGSKTIKTNVRVIAATNKNLEKMVKEGTFREDLWYRLSIFPIYVPPLRERIDDIPLFVTTFADKYGKWVGKRFDMIPTKTIKQLQGYSWPGNIRELSNVVERAAITSPKGTLVIELSTIAGKPPSSTDTLKGAVEKIEREKILEVLNASNWIIEGQKGAAQRIGLTPSSFRRLVKKLDIKRPG